MAYYSDGTKMIEGGQIKSGLDTPVWSTPGSLGNVFNANRPNGGGITFTATSQAGLTPTYEHVGGTLPPGTSISGNALAGTITAVSSDTTYTFTIRAKTLLTADREFTVTVKPPVVTTFAYTGSDQTFAVPAGVNKVEMYLWGAAGGGGYGESYSDKGGPGGATIISSCTVTSGDTLKVQVGQGGWNTSGSNGPLSSSRPYPWGGRPSPRSGYNTGYGGGRSAVFKSNSATAANCLAVAGGGGGSGGLGWAGSLGGRSFCGGPGGGLEGGDGHFVNVNQYGTSTNTGGTQTGIGTSGWGVGGAGVEAAQFKGGDNANPEGTYSGHGGNTGGGGGDGWYGGRAAPYAHSGGGGGSGYVNGAYATGTTYATSDTGHVNSVDSPANPPQTGNTYYGSSAGVAVQNGTGNNGRVVIVY